MLFLHQKVISGCSDEAKSVCYSQTLTAQHRKIFFQSIGSSQAVCSSYSPFVPRGCRGCAVFLCFLAEYRIIAQQMVNGTAASYFSSKTLMVQAFLITDMWWS